MHNVLDYLREHFQKMVGLSLVLSCEIVALVIFSHDREAQKIIVVIMAFTYAMWGITDHLLQHKLNILIILEYILFASLAGFGVLFVLGWSG